VQALVLFALIGAVTPAHGTVLMERFNEPVLEIALEKTLDALDVLPDAGYRDLEPDLREALVVGRPIAET